MKTMLRWASALCMLSVSTMASAGSLPPGGFRVGYNEAWIENYYGTWLADNPFPLFGSSAFNVGCPVNNDGCLVDTMFSGMMQGHAKIVRIWLFPALQGININTNVSPPLTQGFILDSNGNRELIDHLKTVFTLARHYGLKLYITALNAGDAAFVANPNNCTTLPQNEQSNCAQYIGVAYPYFKNLFSNPSATMAYETLVLGGVDGVLDVMSQNQDVIYGFDLIDEIESAINAGYFSWAGAQTWIQNMTKFVSSNSSWSWLPVTSSAGGGYAVQELTFGFFSGRGLNFYDIHIYSDTGTYSGQTWLCSKTKSDGLPIILGEYGQKSTTVNDTIQNTATFQFLYRANSSCFSSALAWKYELTGAASLSYLYISNGALSQPPCPYAQVPGPACARPAYATIQTFCNPPNPPKQCAP